MGILRDSLLAFADQLWVPRCAACDARLPLAEKPGLGAVLCARCADTILETGPARCPVCGLPFDGVAGEHLCRDCILDPPPFSSAAIPYRYGGALADAISRFKYQPAHWLARPLGDLLAGHLLQGGGAEVIVPVPLYPRRLRARGFNQSALLAARLSLALHLPVEVEALDRVRDTFPQAGQDRAQRLANMTGAFLANRRRISPGAAVLLVDDVVTTTATVRAAGRALLDAGAKRVDIAALARAA